MLRISPCSFVGTDPDVAAAWRKRLGFMAGATLLAARAFVGTLVILLSILAMAAVGFVLFSALALIVGVLLSLLIVALLLFSWILGWLGHGGLLH